MCVYFYQIINAHFSIIINYAKYSLTPILCLLLRIYVDGCVMILLFVNFLYNTT